MRRRLFTLCSAGSLLLCAAVCVLWVRSYWVESYAEGHTYWIADGGREGRRAEFWTGSCSGGLFLARQRTWTDDRNAVPLFRPSRERNAFEGKAGRDRLAAQGFRM